MKEIPLTQGRTALVDDEDYEWLSQWKWRAEKKDGKSYAIRRQRDSSGIKKRIWMYRLIMNTPRNMVTDHINGNGLDNRRDNLRVCTRAENAYNTKRESKNPYGYKSIHFHKPSQKYRPSITIKLGEFQSAREVAIAYNKAAKKMFGEFAYLNPVEDK